MSEHISTASNLHHLDPNKTLLVIVDMQNEFCRKEGRLYVHGVDDMIPHLRSLLDQCRNAGVKVIYTQSWRSENIPQFTVFGRNPILIAGNWGTEIISELILAAGDVVVRKHTHDCFFQTEMDRVLATIAPNPPQHTVIVTGVASNVCVYHAVLGFHLRMFNVLVPVDCIKATSQEEDNFALTQFSRSAYSFNVTLTTLAMLRFGSK